MNKKALLLPLLITSQIAISNQSFAEENIKKEEKSAFQKPNMQGDWRILTEFNLYTDHSDSGFTDEVGTPFDYNEDNELYAIGFKKGTMTYGYSYFKNSYYDMSHMLSMEHDFGETGDFDFQIGLGVVTGYKYDIMNGGLFIGDVLLAPLMGIKYEPKFLKFNDIQFAPKIRAMGFQAYMFNLEINYKL
ncbi:MAG: hypothetical protein CL760_06580 [Chloroflexi bacterium]|nr:hypothetical protein [Chloroflexota bacterium]|tara:strand:- start:20591 stop:21157 length:567 start_codon:yes stop_codon:yes gene_type:complete